MSARCWKRRDLWWNGLMGKKKMVKQNQFHKYGMRNWSKLMLTDVLCQSEIFCSLRHLRVDLGGHPDFLSASFFFWEACSWFHSCAVPVYLVSGWTAKEILKKSWIPNSLVLQNLWNPQLGEWKLSNANMNWSWSGEASVTGTVNRPECCMMMRSRWCQWQGSWVSGVEVGLKSSFTSVWDLELTGQKCVYRLYLFRTLECTCDTASTYNQAGAVCLWRHWQLGVKECHGTGWCWYVLARTSLLGGSPQQVHGCGIIFSTLLRSFGTKRTGGTSL